MPPDVESTSGVKTPCLISSIYALGIRSFLFVLVLLVRGGQASGTVAGCIGVEYPHIKESILTRILETFCAYVESCPVVSIG